jgi:hypothetical protein
MRFESLVNGQLQPLQLTGNPQHAGAVSLAEQKSLLGSNTYSSAKGERPLFEIRRLQLLTAQ